MENKALNIDEFLTSIFNDFEAQPDASAFDNIMLHCEHTSHPIDHAINYHLSDIEQPVIDHLPLERLTENSNIIDLSLHRELHQLSVNNENELVLDEIAGRKSSNIKSMAFLLIFLLVGTVITFLVVKFNDDAKLPSLIQNESRIVDSSKIEIAILNQNESTNSNNDNKKSFSKRRYYKTSDNSWSLESQQNFNHQFNHNDFEFDQYKNNESLIFNDDDLLNWERASFLKGIQGQINSLKLEQLLAINRKYQPKYIKSPISFELQIGILDEINAGSKISSSKAHKDASGLVNASYGNQKNGYSMAFSIGYTIGEKIKISSGIQYSRTKSSNLIDYYYTDIPVTDSLGNIKGYWTRPRTNQNHFNQTVENSSTMLSIPSTIQYQFWSNKNILLFTGIGLQFDINRTTKGNYIDFAREELTSQIISKRNFKPNLILGASYKISNTLSISSVLNLGYQQQNFVISNLPYLRKEFVPSLQFGLIYNPVIKK